MKTNFKLLAMAAVAMLSMNACNQDEEVLNNPEQKGEPVEFVMGVNAISRTTTADDSFATTFAEGDEVGIFAYNGETEVARNARYKYTSGAWEAQGTPIYAEEGVSYSYYAYYPYNAEASDVNSVSLSVAADQTSGYTASDALMAKSENVGAGTTTVSLQYNHAFALVQVQLSGDQATEGATVTLQNVYPTAALNLKEGTVGETSGTLGTVVMKPLTTNTATAPYSYRAIVPAQTIAANNAILTTTSGETTYRFTYSAAVPYEQGKLRQINVTLGDPSGTEITIEGAKDVIKDWEASTDVDGEGSVGEVVEPVTLIEVPITAETVATTGGKYASNNRLDMDNEGWFTRYNEDYGASVSFVSDTATITLSDTISTARTGWNWGSFGYHANGPLAGKSYRVTCTINATNGSRGGIMIRTSGDNAGFSIPIISEGEQTGLRTIHSFTANGSNQSISFTVNTAQKNETASSNSLSNFVSTEDTDWTDCYIYIYNQTPGATMNVSNIRLELVTE